MRVNLSEITPANSEGNRALLTAKCCGIMLIPEHLHKDQYCRWKYNSVWLLQSQYLQRYTDDGFRCCVHTSLLLESPSWAVPAPWDFSSAPPWSYCRILPVCLGTSSGTVILLHISWCVVSTRVQLWPDLSSAANWVECKGHGEWVVGTPPQRHWTNRRMHFYKQRGTDRKSPKLLGEWETEGDLLGSYSGL